MSWPWVAGFGLGWLVTYLAIMRYFVRNFRGAYPTIEWSFGDTIFIIGWPALVALGWPVVGPVFLLATVLHPRIKAAAERSS